MLESALRMVFPDQCLLCKDLVQSRGGLCGPCWRDTPFIAGHACDLCGGPLVGPDASEGMYCDDCWPAGRPWEKGRALLVYEGGARRLILGLKHGDRLDLAPALGRWMAARARDLAEGDMLIAPVPLHWRRLLRRRYNQSAVLAHHLGRNLGLSVCPDLLQRTRRTESQDGKGADQRFANLAGAIRIHPGRASRMQGKTVLLVDDVMTSGATLSACTTACLTGGAAAVRVMALARVVKDA
jgi:ComF family protein